MHMHQRAAGMQSRWQSGGMADWHVHDWHVAPQQTHLCVVLTTVCGCLAALLLHQIAPAFRKSPSIYLQENLAQVYSGRCNACARTSLPTLSAG
jgi:hypothetical protein